LLLARALRLLPPLGTNKKVIAFVGAGGKTTAIFQLARQLPPPVLVTTTTHLGTWQVALADQHVTGQSIRELADHEFHGVTLVTGSVQGERVVAVKEDILYWLRAYQQEHDGTLLIEADGSHQKPLKAPNEYEPVIPRFTDEVAVVAGLGGLGKPLNAAHVHRPQFFSSLSGLSLNDEITPEAVTRVLTDPSGGLKNVLPSARRIVFLNQADTAELQAVGGKQAGPLLETFDAAVVGSLEQSRFQTFERTAGIVLAAGGSARFGQPKQLLDWHGEPFIRVVTKTALKAGLSPVIVVIGANAEQVQSRTRDLPVRIIRNESWETGQGSSIRAGVQAIPDRTGAAVFLLADQPQIKADVIRALIDHHSTELYPIIAPLVLMEQRANPVLFDRITFPDLLKLDGDVGGRAIFSKYPVEYLPWQDDRLLLDVDQPDDYRRLIEDDTL